MDPYDDNALGVEVIPGVVKTKPIEPHPYEYVRMNHQKSNDHLAKKDHPDDGTTKGAWWYDVKVWGVDDSGSKVKVTVRTLDIIQAKKMNHALGEAFCAMMRMGTKPGCSKERDLNKALTYLQEELEALKQKTN